MENTYTAVFCDFGPALALAVDYQTAINAATKAAVETGRTAVVMPDYFGSWSLVFPDRAPVWLGTSPLWERMTSLIACYERN